MVASLEQLHQEITALTQTAAELAQAIREAFSGYLTALAKAIQTQLTQTSFHLCTQMYPAAFLQLSVSERQSLQQEIQGVIRELVASLPETQHPLKSLIESDDLNPTRLVETWEAMEQGIIQQLRQGARMLNQQLEAHHIMKFRSLDKLLDIAAKAEAAGRTITNPPHLLKAMVDPSRDDELDPGEPVVAIYLQLADLEFTDPALMNWRQHLRPLIQKMIQLQKTYAQKQEDLLIAEASAAWRSIWVADAPGLEE